VELLKRERKTKVNTRKKLLRNPLKEFFEWICQIFGLAVGSLSRSDIFFKFKFI